MAKVPVNKSAMVCMFVCHQKCRTEEGVGNAQLRPSEALVNYKYRQLQETFGIGSWNVLKLCENINNEKKGLNIEQ